MLHGRHRGVCRTAGGHVTRPHGCFLAGLPQCGAQLGNELTIGEALLCLAASKLFMLTLELLLWLIGCLDQLLWLSRGFAARATALCWTGQCLAYFTSPDSQTMGFMFVSIYVRSGKTFRHYYSRALPQCLCGFQRTFKVCMTNASAIIASLRTAKYFLGPRQYWEVWSLTGGSATC